MLILVVSRCLHVRFNFPVVCTAGTTEVGVSRGFTGIIVGVSYLSITITEVAITGTRMEFITTAIW